MKKNLNNKKMMAIIFTLIVISVLLLAYFFIKPEVKEKEIHVFLNGSEHQAISLLSEYVDDGFKMKIGKEEVDTMNLDYKMSSTIDPSVPGKYEVNYEIMYDNQIYHLKRVVEVKDEEAPVLTIEQEVAEKYFCKKTNKMNLSYRAEDNYDGIITDKVKVEVGEKNVVLSVSDSSGNETRKEIPLKEMDDQKVAIIELKGKETVYIPLGGTYEEEGATLIDGCGDEKSEEITITGNVDTQTPGEYEVNYQYKDDNQKVIKTRKVIVYEIKKNENIQENSKKIVYLTFDDGPGQYTEELLNILKKHDVKVTFFVTNQFKKYVPLIKRESEEGHVVAVHSLTHNWKIYQSVETYMKDFNDMNEIVAKYTGEKSKLFRFPGGSSNTISRKYAKGVVSSIASHMTKNGYTYFDWNVDSEDAAGASSKQILSNAINGINSRDVSVVLMHDIKKNTIAVIEEFIVYAKENGFTFKTLSPSAQTVHHHINN